MVTVRSNNCPETAHTGKGWLNQTGTSAEISKKIPFSSGILIGE